MSLNDTKQARCRAVKQLRTHAGVIEASSQGTVLGEVESLGRRLIRVKWDNGITVNVFPDEIDQANQEGR